MIFQNTSDWEFMLSLDNSYLRLIHGGPVLNLKASQPNYHFPTIMELHGMWPRLELGNRCYRQSHCMVQRILV